MAEVVEGSGSSPRTVRDMPSLRASTVTAFELCPRQWASRYYYGTEEKESAALRTGTAAHSVIEDALRGRPLDLSVMKDVKRPGESKAVLEYVSSLEGLRAKTWLVEHRWELPWRSDAPPLSGTMDVVAVDPDMLLIADHKTNRKPETVDDWKKKIQPRLYAYAARRLWDWTGYPMIRFQIGYVLLGIEREWTIGPEEDDITIARVGTAWDAMLEYERLNGWPERLNPYCRYCPIKNYCQSFAQSEAAAKSFFPNFAK